LAHISRELNFIKDVITVCICIYRIISCGCGFPDHQETGHRKERDAQQRPEQKIKLMMILLPASMLIASFVKPTIKPLHI